MASIESSVIIPVYNKWDLTRDCLKSLASTVDGNRVEVIVVDNASTDVTPRACVFLGERLFGESFKYIRNETNRNFAGASNQGAEAANGEFLIFLNNDAVCRKGWYEPLLRDFSDYPDIAATGPILAYPDPGPFGATVQHLGVCVAPNLKFGHLYKDIPLASPLAKKRRFFQAITAACMMIRRSLFMGIGKFDEEFKNGFEDVDLCGRLVAAGRRFTINPASLVVHRESQTPGRNANEAANFARARQKSAKYFRPDWDSLLRNDDLILGLNALAHFQTLPARPPEFSPQLDKERLKTRLIDNIYWEDGWKSYLNKISDEAEYLENFKVYFRLFRNVPVAAEAVRLGRKSGDRELAKTGEAFLNTYSETPEKILASAEIGKERCESLGLSDLARRFALWIHDYDHFKNEIYPLYQAEYFSVLKARS